MLKRVFNLNSSSQLDERRIHQRSGTRGLDKEIAEKRRQIAEVEEQERAPEQTNRVSEQPEEENLNDYIYIGAVVGTRHGDTPSNAQGVTIGDTITGESVNKLHRIGRKDLRAILEDSGIGTIREEDIRVKHSDKKRTELTARALVSGTLSGKEQTGREEPHSPEDLGKYSLSGVQFEKDDRIGYKKGAATVHEKLFTAEKTGAHQVLNHWLQNPIADKHAHEKYGEAKIEPFISVYKRTKETLQDALKDVSEGKHKLFVIGSHGTLKEPMVISMLYAAGARNITNIEQIGGPVQKGENFVVLVRQNRRTGRNEGVVRFRGNAFAFDLENFLDNSKDAYIAEVNERLKRGEFDRARPGRPNPHYAGQNAPPSYDLNHEPSQEELAQMELRGERGYETNTRLHEPKAKKEDLPANRYGERGRYAKEAKPVREERKYQPANK